MGSTPTPGSIVQHGATVSTILVFAFYMKKEGYRDSTIERAVKVLKGLSKHCDLSDLDRHSAHCVLGCFPWKEARVV